MRTTTASVPNVSSGGVDKPALTIDRGYLPADLPNGSVQFLPRILRADPAAAAALIGQALRSIRKVEFGDICTECYGSSLPKVKIVHSPSCGAGQILAYVDAINDARMGTERRRESSSLGRSSMVAR